MAWDLMRKYNNKGYGFILEIFNGVGRGEPTTDKWCWSTANLAESICKQPSEFELIHCLGQGTGIPVPTTCSTVCFKLKWNPAKVVNHQCPVKWAVVDKLILLLILGQNGQQPPHVLITKKLDDTGHWWLTILARFGFSLKYWPDVWNRDANVLFQWLYNTKITEARWNWLMLDSIQPLRQWVTYKACGTTGAKATGDTAIGVPKLYSSLTQVTDNGLPTLGQKNLGGTKKKIHSVD